MPRQHGEVRFLRTRPVTHEKAWVDANGNPLSLAMPTPDNKHLQGNDKDGDLRNRLTIAPDLVVSLLAADNSAVVYNKTRKIILHGVIWLDLLPLLAEGELNNVQLAQRLAGQHSALAVRTALYHLLAKGIIVANQHRLTAAQALSWASAGLTPCAAEQRLAATPLHTATLTDTPFPATLLAKLQECGAWRHTVHHEEAAWVIYFVDSYQQRNIASVNAQHLADGKKWLLLQLQGDTALCGPLFCAAPHPTITNRPCWECLRTAMADNDNIDAFLQHRPHQRLPHPTPQSTTHVAVLATQLQAELAALLLDNESAAPLRGHLLEFSLSQVNRAYHWVVQRPQCHACGYGKLAADRPLRPLHLQTRIAGDFTSGGIRTRSAEHTFTHWRKYLSPITGATGDLLNSRGRYHTNDGSAWDWLHNTVGGKNNSLPDKEPLPSMLKKGFRRRTGGKGSTAVQSYVSAICESFERSAGVFRDQDERYRWARWRDFKEDEAIAPNAIALFSEAQYRNRKNINAQGNPYNFVPEPFDVDSDEVVRWTPVWSLSEARPKHLLTSSLYYAGVDAASFTKYRYACSNGTAGGATLEEAILQGLYELIERDACAIWWYNRLCLPPVAWEEFDDPWLCRAKTFYAALQRNLWLLDMTDDLGVPACVALSRNVCPAQPDKIIFGFGAHLDQRVAVYRAIAEMNQMLEGLDLACPDGVDLATWLQSHSCPATVNWITAVSTDDSAFRWLLPAAGVSPRTYPSPQYRDTREEIDYLRTLVENKGMEMLVLDQSRAEVDCRVARVIVPGLRHFWSRLAPGRLYDVPVARGQLPQAHREEEMNPQAMFM